MKKILVSALLATGFFAVQAADVVVKIGSVAPLTGGIAHLGKDNTDGAKMAIEDLNAKGIKIGGKTIEFQLVSEDDAADAKTATVVAQKLVDAKVVGVVGHLNSGTSIPASKIYSDAGIPQISPSATNPRYTMQGFKTTFRVVANDIQQGGALGDLAKKLGAKTVMAIDDRTAYGQGLADEFVKAANKAGLKLLGREYTNDKAVDFKAILTNVKGKKPDLVMYGGMDATAAPLLKQMRELGIKAKFIGGDGMQTPEFIKLAGADAEGAVGTMAGLPPESMPGGAQFKKDFERRFQQVQIYAPYCYDAVMVLVEAMKKADSTDPAKYLPKLAAITYKGVTGEISFDKKGDLRKGAITAYSVKGGEWKVFK